MYSLNLFLKLSYSADRQTYTQTHKAKNITSVTEVNNILPQNTALHITPISLGYSYVDFELPAGNVLCIY